MYLISLVIEDVNKGEDGEVISDVMVISDLKSVTPENLKPVVEKLCYLACEKEFMRKGAR